MTGSGGTPNSDTPAPAASRHLPQRPDGRPPAQGAPPIPLTVLYQLPTWLLGSLIVGTYGAFGYFGCRLLDRRLKPHSSNNLVSDTIRSIVACYSVLLGLTAVTTWDNFKQVQATVRSEAFALSDLYRDVDSYDEPERSRMRNSLRTYARLVLSEEWPAQQRGRMVPGADGLVATLLQDQHHVRVSGQVARLAHDTAQSRLERLVQDRRLRRSAITSGLHPMMWFIVLVGGALTITLTFFYTSEHRRLKRAMAVCLAGMIGLVVFWIFALDHPLWGNISIPADTFATVLTEVMGDGLAVSR